jgi:hypothetical protein
MTTLETFNAYFEFRADKAGAMTPGAKLALIKQLQAEAQQGRVPVGRDAVGKLPVDSPSVQAVLAGEPVSMGAARIESVLDGDKARQILNRVQNTPMLQYAIAAISILLIAAGIWSMFAGFGKDEPVSSIESTAETASVDPAEDNGTVILAESAPPTKVNDPASIEIGSTSFVLGRGTLKKGAWDPDQAEWLEGTEIRRVVAIPKDNLAKPIVEGDLLRVRIRSGEIVTYKVVAIDEVQRTQIEVLFSLEPSLVVVLYDDTASSTREIVVATLETSMETEGSTEPVYLVSSPVGEVNLRDEPGGSVIGVLTNGTVLTILPDEPVNRNGYKWVRVRTSYNTEGWAASSLLAEVQQ